MPHRGGDPSPLRAASPAAPSNRQPSATSGGDPGPSPTHPERNPHPPPRPPYYKLLWSRAHPVCLGNHDSRSAGEAAHRVNARFIAQTSSVVRCKRSITFRRSCPAGAPVQGLVEPPVLFQGSAGLAQGGEDSVAEGPDVILASSAEFVGRSKSFFPSKGGGSAS